MEQPKTYNGYNNEGTLIASYTGADANQKINPAEVQAKIDNVVQVTAEQTKKICSALENVRTDVNSAVIVQGANMDSFLQTAEQAVADFSSDIESIIHAGDIYNAAVDVHDKLQEQNNNAAYQSTAGTSGVVKTVEV